MRKKIIISTIIFIIIAIVVAVSLYIAESGFRDWIDVNILRKDITEKDLPVISLNADKLNQVHVYNKYIALLNNKAVTLYNGFGEEVTKIDIDINNGIFDSNNKYFAVAEYRGNKLSLILDKTYLWSAVEEGEILQIYVNRNGYVCVITTDSVHRAILNLFNPSGKKLFKSYFSSTRIVDASISDDNKFIAVGEIDTTGSAIKSNVKIISIENAQKDPEKTIIYEQNENDGNMLVNVKYQDDGRVICMYDKKIEIIENNQNTKIFDSEEKKASYMTAEFNNNIVYVEEAEANLKIMNTLNKEEKSIQLEKSPKEIYAKDNTIGINLGSEMYFYDTNAWLLKKYTSNKEITNVEFSRSLAALIYKDKIIVISF